MVGGQPPVEKAIDRRSLPLQRHNPGEGGIKGPRVCTRKE